MSLRILSTTLAIGVAAALYALPSPSVHAQAAPAQRSSSSTHEAPPPSASDQQFMKDLAEGNKAEIETGKLAQKSAASEDVKAFGTMMVDDHTRALQQLETLASHKGVQLPKSPNAKQASAAKSLQSLKGDSFDKRYATMAVSDHEETLALLKKVEQNAKDADLRKFAADTTPVVSRHLDHAKKLTGMR